MNDSPGLSLHEDVALFSETVNYTTSRTGFSSRIVEKDYFCSVLLKYVTESNRHQLVFKGGTCLSKVHAEFYRLSEDLDFMISLPVDAGRQRRRQCIEPVKKIINEVSDQLPCFKTTQPLTGANNSAQYNGQVSYRSPTTGNRDVIRIEISLRESLLLPIDAYPAKTLLLNPVNNQPAVLPFKVNCIDLLEAMAEKFRAALSRKDVAIRDFYDIYYAVKRLLLKPHSPQMIELVRRKLAMPGNLPIDVSTNRMSSLDKQLETQLRAVLRDQDFQVFKLSEAIAPVLLMAEKLG